MTVDLESLWHSHRARLFGYVFIRVHDHDVADDLVSAVYLRALVAIRNGHGASSNETAWLFTIARSVLCDHWRAFQHMTFVDFDTLTEEPDACETPQHSAERGIMRERILCGVTHLGDSYEAIMSLRLEGYAFAEIGDLLGITTAAAKQRGTRAYATLREPVAGLVAFVEASG